MHNTPRHTDIQLQILGTKLGTVFICPCFQVEKAGNVEMKCKIAYVFDLRVANTRTQAKETAGHK